jgi:hypothetical protein
MNFTIESGVSQQGNGEVKPPLNRLERLIYRGASFNSRLREAVFTYTLPGDSSQDPYIEMFVPSDNPARSELLEQVLGTRAGRKITPEGVLLEFDHPEFDFLLEPLEPQKNTRNMEDQRWIDALYLGAMLTRDPEKNKIVLPTPIARPLVDAFSTLHSYNIGHLKVDTRKPRTPLMIEEPGRVETELLENLRTEGIVILKPLYRALDSIKVTSEEAID